MKKPIKLGIVGVGPWAERYVGAVRRLWPGGEVDIVAYTRRSPVPAHNMRGMRPMPSFEDMLFDDGMDGFIVAASPEIHGTMAKLAVIKGAPVLVEKPLALTAAECQSVLDVVEGHPYTLIDVDHVHLWAPAFRLMQESLRDTRVRHVASRWHGPGPFRSWSALADWGVHPLALFFDLVSPLHIGEFVVERSSVTSDEGRGRLWSFVLRAGDVTAGFIVGNGSGAKRAEFEVETVAGQEYRYDALADPSARLVVNGTGIMVPPTPPLDIVLQAFVDRVRLRRDVPSLRFSYSGVRLALAAAEVLDAVARQTGT